MAASTGHYERWAELRAILGNGLRNNEPVETIISRLLLELRDHGEDDVEVFREELLAFFEQEQLKVGALEREVQLVGDFLLALREEMTLAGVEVARDLPRSAVASALEKAAASTEISREQARRIVLRWFPADRERLG